jgi:phosphoglycerate dehydrogenase-like enzyme
MNLFISIGESNQFQLDRLKELLPSDIVIVDDYKIAELFLITRWHDDYYDSRIEAVFIPYTGKNRFPLDNLYKKGIKVLNTHAKAHLVAERAFTLALTVLGKIPTYHQALAEEGRWLTRDDWGEEFWRSLQKKSVGIIGMGHIANELLNYLKPFQTRLVNLERDKHKGLADVYVPAVDQLIIESDIIFLCCELNESTKGIINNSHLDLLNNKVIINVSRGEVLNEETLYLGLRDNILYGAGIDVWYQYPTDTFKFPSKYELSSYKNLVMSPHASCHAEAFKNDYYDDIFEKIINYVRS